MPEPTAVPIPDYMMPGLRRWIEHGEMPGSFLQAVLENDLREACRCADATNIRILPAYVGFLHNSAPAACWGSPAKVQAWIEAHAKQRAAAAREAGDGHGN